MPDLRKDRRFAINKMMVSHFLELRSTQKHTEQNFIADKSVKEVKGGFESNTSHVNEIVRHVHSDDG